MLLPSTLKDETRRSKRDITARVLFTPGMGADKNWCDGPPNVVTTKRQKRIQTIGETPSKWDEGLDNETPNDLSAPVQVHHTEDCTEAYPNPVRSNAPVGITTPPPSARRCNGPGLDSDSDATVLMEDEDELSVNTASPRPSPTIRSLMVENSPRWVGSSIQTLIMRSIDWRELRKAVKGDIVTVVNKEILKDDLRLIIESQIMKYSKIENIDLESIPTGGVINGQKLNRMVAKVAKRAIFKTICFESLAEDIVEHILNAMDFESLKEKAIEKILRNTAPAEQLEQLMDCAGGDMDV
jgi:hypothetical protein